MRIQSSHHHADRGLDAYFSPPEAVAMIGDSPGYEHGQKHRSYGICKGCTPMRKQMLAHPASLAACHLPRTAAPWRP